MKAIENAVAPSRIANTIAVIFTVSSELSYSIFHENLPYSTASTTAPTLPSAEDSVGVAIPAKIEPSTTMINASGGTMAFSAAR